METGDRKAYSNLLQCQSVAVQSGNAEATPASTTSPPHDFFSFYFNDYLFILYEQFFFHPISDVQKS